MRSRTGHNPHTELAAYTKQGVISHGHRPMCCAIEQGAIHIQSRQHSQSESMISHNRRSMCCAREQGAIHPQGWQLSHSKSAVSNNHQPIVFHNRREYNAPSMRATLTKQVCDFAQPSAHVLCNRTEHNPHTELAACTKRGMISHIHQPIRLHGHFSLHDRIGHDSLAKQVAFAKHGGDIAHPSAHVLRHRTGHNPHTGRAAFAKQVRGIA